MKSAKTRLINQLADDNQAHLTRIASKDPNISSANVDEVLNKK